MPVHVKRAYEEPGARRRLRWLCEGLPWSALFGKREWGPRNSSGPHSWWEHCDARHRGQTSGTQSRERAAWAI